MVSLNTIEFNSKVITLYIIILFVAIFLPDQAELHHNCDRFLIILGVLNDGMVLLGGNVIDIPIANIKLVYTFLYQHPIEL